MNPIKFIAKAFGIKNYSETVQYSPQRSRIKGSVQDSNEDWNGPTKTECLRQARFFADNDGTASRLLDVTEQYSSDVDVIPDSSSTEYNNAALAYWKEWQEKPDIASKRSFKSVKAIAQRSRLVDGDMFFLKTLSPDSKKPRLQLIEAHQVKTPPEFSNKEGSTFFDGVEIDPRTGRAKKYWIEGFDGDYYSIDEFNIIQLVDTNRPNQYRGITHFYPVLPLFRDLKDMSDSEIGAIKDGAKTSKVIKTKFGEVPAKSGGLAGKVRQTNPVSGRSRADVLLDEGGPETIVLSTDESYEQFQNLRPAEELQHFWDTKLGEACAGFGLPIQLIYPQKTSGATQRVVLELADSFFSSQCLVMEEAVKEIFYWVMVYASNDPEADPILKNRPKDWKKVTVSYPKSPGIDDSRKSTYQLAEYKVGARTLSSITSDIGNGDWKSVLRQKAVEAQYRKQLAKEFDVSEADISAAVDNQFISSPVDASK